MKNFLLSFTIASSIVVAGVQISKANTFEKPAKYSDAWWKEVAEFNKARKAQEK
jgi:hypothetical protein